MALVSIRKQFSGEFGNDIRPRTKCSGGCFNQEAFFFPSAKAVKHVFETAGHESRDIVKICVAAMVGDSVLWIVVRSDFL